MPSSRIQDDATISLLLWDSPLRTRRQRRHLRQRLAHGTWVTQCATSAAVQPQSASSHGGTIGSLVHPLLLTLQKVPSVIARQARVMGTTILKLRFHAHTAAAPPRRLNLSATSTLVRATDQSGSGRINAMCPFRLNRFAKSGCAKKVG